jgi:PAS domain S-box-containing protein
MNLPDDEVRSSDRQSSSWDHDSLSVELLVDRLEDKQSILNSISEAVMLLDATNYKILDVNRAFLDTYKLSNEDFVGRRCYEMTHHLNQPCSQVFRDETCPLERSLSTGKMCRVEHVHADHEGNRLYFEITAYPLKTATGKINRIVHLAKDVTERKLAEEAVETNAEKTKLFAYSVAHDLKGPAIGIHGLAQRLGEHYGKILDERGRTYCSQILKASEEIAALVGNINSFISAKEAPLRIERIDLKSILETLNQEYSAQLNARRIHWSKPDRNPEINADRVSIVRILRNLIDNALKYGGDGLSEIKIGYEASADSHIISVSDDGVGMGVDDPTRLFDPFQRNYADKETEGSGLGLAIVNEIARQHSGKVWFESEPGKGATFRVEISKNLT